MFGQYVQISGLREIQNISVWVVLIPHGVCYYSPARKLEDKFERSVLATSSLARTSIKSRSDTTKEWGFLNEKVWEEKRQVQMKTWNAKTPILFLIIKTLVGLEKLHQLTYLHHSQIHSKLSSTKTPKKLASWFKEVDNIKYSVDIVFWIDQISSPNLQQSMVLAFDTTNILKWFTEIYTCTFPAYKSASASLWKPDGWISAFPTRVTFSTVRFLLLLLLGAWWSSFLALCFNLNFLSHWGCWVLLQSRRMTNTATQFRLLVRSNDLKTYSMLFVAQHLSILRPYCNQNSFQVYTAMLHTHSISISSVPKKHHQTLLHCNQDWTVLNCLKFCFPFHGFQSEHFKQDTMFVLLAPLKLLAVPTHLFCKRYAIRLFPHPIVLFSECASTLSLFPPQRVGSDI